MIVISPQKKLETRFFVKATVFFMNGVSTYTAALYGDFKTTYKAAVYVAVVGRRVYVQGCPVPRRAYLLRLRTGQCLC